MMVYIAHWETGEYSSAATGVIGVFLSHSEAEKAVLTYVGGEEFHIDRAEIGVAIDPIVVSRYHPYCADASGWRFHPRPSAAADGGPLRDGTLVRDQTQLEKK